MIYQQTLYCFNIYLFTEERKVPGGCWHNCDTIEFIAFSWRNVIFPPKVSMLGDLANLAQKGFELLLLPALVHRLMGGLSRASEDVLQLDWPWAGWIRVPKVSYWVGAVASQPPTLLLPLLWCLMREVCSSLNGRRFLGLTAERTGVRLNPGLSGSSHSSPALLGRYSWPALLALRGWDFVEAMSWFQEETFPLDLRQCWNYSGR